MSAAATAPLSAFLEADRASAGKLPEFWRGFWRRRRELCLLLRPLTSFQPNPTEAALALACPQAENDNGEAWYQVSEPKRKWRWPISGIRAKGEKGAQVSGIRQKT